MADGPSRNLGTTKRYLLRWFLPLLICSSVGFGYYQWRCSGNFQSVIEGEIYRAGQPNEEKLRLWIREHGIRTVINLRGRNSQYRDMEARVTSELGVELVDLTLTAYKLIPNHTLDELITIIEEAERPLLLHCSHGIDRSGVASALATWLLGYETYDVARQRSTELPMPWKPKLNGCHISDIFDVWEGYCADHGRGPNDADHFRVWVREIFHPHYYNVRLEATENLRVSPGQTVSLPVTITHLAEMPIPGSDPEKSYALCGDFIPSRNENLDHLVRFLTPLPEEDIATGQQLRIEHEFTAPDRPGQYELLLDLLERDVTKFKRQGSTPLSVEVIVN